MTFSVSCVVTPNKAKHRSFQPTSPTFTQEHPGPPYRTVAAQIRVTGDCLCCSKPGQKPWGLSPTVHIFPSVLIFTRCGFQPVAIWSGCPFCLVRSCPFWISFLCASGAPLHSVGSPASWIPCFSLSGLTSSFWWNMSLVLSVKEYVGGTFQQPRGLVLPSHFLTCLSLEF